MKVFYSHLVVIEDLTSELDKWEIASEEKAEMLQLIEETLHHHTLNVILNHLPGHKHNEFLENLENNPENGEMLQWLKSEISGDIEAAIKVQADRIKKELLLEIRKSRKT